MTALFLFFEKANVRAVAPVLRRLVERGRLPPLFVRGFDYKEHIGQIAPLIPPPGIPCADIRDYERAVETDGPVAIARNAAITRTIDAGARPEPPSAEPVAELVAELYAELVGSELMAMLAARVDAITAALERLVAERRPSVAVLPEDTDYARGRLAARLLARLGVPTVVILPLYYQAIIQYPLLGARYAERFVVMNEATAERLYAQGVRHDRVLVAGSVCLEGLGPRAPDSVARPPRPPVFLFVLQQREWELDIVADLLDIARAEPSWAIWIKPHPECPATYLDGRFEAPANVTRVIDRALREILPACTAVIGQTSTALYEALASGVPAIAVDYGAFPHELALPGGEAFPGLAHDPDELRAAMRACADGRRRPDATGWIGPTEGVTERLVALLETFAAS